MEFASFEAIKIEFNILGDISEDLRVGTSSQSPSRCIRQFSRRL